MRRQTTAEWVEQELLARLLDGDGAAAQPLPPVPELAAELMVPQSAVRSALSGLVAVGLLEYRGNRYRPRGARTAATCDALHLRLRSPLAPPARREALLDWWALCTDWAIQALPAAAARPEGLSAGVRQAVDQLEIACGAARPSLDPGELLFHLFAEASRQSGRRGLQLLANTLGRSQEYALPWVGLAFDAAQARTLLAAVRPGTGVAAAVDRFMEAYAGRLGALAARADVAPIRRSEHPADRH